MDAEDFVFYPNNGGTVSEQQAQNLKKGCPSIDKIMELVRKHLPALLEKCIEEEAKEYGNIFDG